MHRDTNRLLVNLVLQLTFIMIHCKTYVCIWLTHFRPPLLLSNWQKLLVIPKTFHKQCQQWGCNFQIWEPIGEITHLNHHINSDLCTSSFLPHLFFSKIQIFPFLFMYFYVHIYFKNLILESHFRMKATWGHRFSFWLIPKPHAFAYWLACRLVFKTH